ncbi:hypothetical protein BV20DRAFT_962661 [Pilatotrama ljubarskyi]|nr:hypothetical protein BV20DRAFT_969543 [Pilatotrama ljubarskyi]KAI0373450.1 hypothetical protein BV20DRAFT_962605 [Pilatotrama ljubarskyi]KAI0373497.1 hypothetical protein BV20DRAFT_962661 [Pilatotrama ljubarskyi]
MILVEAHFGLLSLTVAFVVKRVILEHVQLILPAAIGIVRFKIKFALIADSVWLEVVRVVWE